MESFDVSLGTAPAEGVLSPALLLVPPGLPLGEGPFPGWGSWGGSEGTDFTMDNVV